MEAAILERESAVQALEKELEDPKLASDPRAVQKRWRALAEAKAQVDGLYERWKELGEKQK